MALSGFVSILLLIYVYSRLGPSNEELETGLFGGAANIYVNIFISLEYYDCIQDF